MSGFQEKLAQTCANCIYLCPDYHCAKKMRGKIKKEHVKFRGKYCTEWEYNDPDKALGESTFKAIHSFDDIEEKVEKKPFLDIKVIEMVCASEIVTISQLLDLIEPFEALLAEEISFKQLWTICEKYNKKKLINKIM